MADLIDRREVADLLGVTPRTVQRYTERDDFPSPAKLVGRARLWERRDVQRWKKKTLPLPQGRAGHRTK